MKVEETIHIVGGIYFRSVRLKKNLIIPQHTHDHDHATYIGSGRVQLFVDGELKGEYSAGEALEMKAGKVHAFRSLEDNTLLACVWPESIGETFSKN
jgi:quercetin dioxygenase-like cupin family protein